MSRAESGVLGAAAVAVEYADDLILRSAQEVHTSISARVYGVGDAVSRCARGTRGGASRRRVPVTPWGLSRVLHDGISSSLYEGISLGLKGAQRALRAADEAGIGPNVEDSASGRFVVSAVNGLVGDSLRDSSPRFSFEMGLRHDGAHVPLEPAAVAASYPDASDALVVFVHGLCETEDYWLRRRRPRQPTLPEPGSYGRRLAADEGWSPVFLRANTGITIAESGVALSALLGRLVEIWPTEVRRIALVGHSLGGLIIHSACAVEHESTWTERLTDVVTLGTPHLGSPVERSIARGLRIAEKLPELAPYRRIFSQRSAAVLELHDGLPDVVPLEHVTYHLVAGSLSRSPRHPVALGIGDLLVQPRSAWAMPRGAVGPFPDADRLHVPGADHFDLLNHDQVYAALRGWLRNRGRGGPATPPPDSVQPVTQEIA